MGERTAEKDLPKALIAWYDFKPDSEALFLAGGNTECEVLLDVLREKNGNVMQAFACEVADLESEFDYIIGADILEKSDDPIVLLRTLLKKLKPHGKLLLGTENRLGIRYFCGDKDIFTGHVFDGVDGYRHVGAERRKVIGSRAYDKSELKRMLLEAGFVNNRFYSVMPCLARPQVLISEEYLPNEPIDIRVFPQYQSPETVFLEEEQLYQTLLENGMLHQMANAYLIECSVEGCLSDFDQITVQGDRDHRDALVTLIKKNQEVRKRALYFEGEGKIAELFEKTRYLKQHGVPMVDAHVEGTDYVMPYVKGLIATEYFQKILQKDKDLFLQEVEKFRDLILMSSEHVPYEEVNWKQFDPDWKKSKKDDPNIDKWKKLAFGTKEEQQEIGVILKRGFVDMVSLNCFHTDKGFLFFDQEFDIENFPVNAIMIRTIDLIYRDRNDLELLYPREDLLHYFHLQEHCKVWRKYAKKFLEELRNEKELSVYHRACRRDWQTVAANRHRMNYSQEEYDKLFTNIFKDIDNKKIYLFGSGRFAEKFIEQFGKYCTIAGVVDNNNGRWGQTIDGIEIDSPAILQKREEPFKVFICIKFFEEVLKQLKEMGIKNYAVYNPALEYDRPMKIVTALGEKSVPKKYHIGYVAGVFDLFHVGHLNLLRRAKEQCDYLIVGVVSDEQVINDKMTKPYVPFENRLAIVQACRYVDEAVEIPMDNPGTEAAYHRYHFDVQFSGSDYENDLTWLSKREFLRRHGAELVFFPYTESTSSSKIKEMIDRKLV